MSKTYTSDELRALATRYKYGGILVLTEDMKCIIDFITWLEEESRDE